MNLKPLMTAVTLAMVLPACSLAPSYRQPATPVADQWPQGEAYTAQTGAPAADLGWREFFPDQTLQYLIAVALEHNRDLRVATLTVDAYRAQYRIERAQQFPSLDAYGDGVRQRLPADLSQTGVADIASQYSVGLTTSWEVDLFGRVRSLRDQALEQYLATAEAQRGVHISLVAEVADAYLTWQTDRALLDLTRGTLETYRQSLDLVEQSQQAGVASALDVRQARTAVDNARAQLARYTRLVANDSNALQFLTGSPLRDSMPAGTDAMPTASGTILPLLAELPAGLPSELLQRRPDIRAAEHRLIAANANIGAARAAFFPNIRLTAAAGSASSEIGGLFDAGSGSWSFMPQISLPIFHAGKLRANLDYAQIQKDIRVAEYEQSIQRAFREVADGLAARSTFGQQLEAQQDLVRNTQEYVSLADERYQAGVDNYLVLLDAQRLLFGAQQQLLQDQLAQRRSAIQLYKALGGGWQSASAEVSAR